MNRRQRQEERGGMDGGKEKVKRRGKGGCGTGKQLIGHWKRKERRRNRGKV